MRALGRTNRGASMKSLLSAPLKHSIFTTLRNLFWTVPCLLLPLVFTGCGANHSMAAPTTVISTPAAAATPVFSPAPGTYLTAQTVTLSAATAGATIYYTADGTAPTTSSTPYTGAIPVSGSEVIEAVAVASGYTNSSLATAGYVITPPRYRDLWFPQTPLLPATCRRSTHGFSTTTRALPARRLGQRA